MTTERIKILKDAIKWINSKGEKERTRVSYSQGSYTKESGIPQETITIYGRNYKSLPPELNPENNSDSQTDYFENDRALISPNNKYYKQILKAMQGKKKSEELRSQKKASQVMATDEALMSKIKKLAQVSQDQALLDYTDSGYMRDDQRREIFGRMAKHNVRHKLKYSYVDHNNSGKFLVSTTGTDKGNVFGIKAYGQKGHHVGEIGKVISDMEKNNQRMIDRIVNKLGEGLKKSQGNL